MNYSSKHAELEIFQERITSQIGRDNFSTLATPVTDIVSANRKVRHADSLVLALNPAITDTTAQLSYLNALTNRQKDTCEAYWYHPDHLGSSSWITYSDGSAVQHLYYLPWGEDFVDQKTTSFSSMYTFSAKEKDTETGYLYFGARYYSSDLSIWLSVDPMSDKYPSSSPYAYCRNNPIILVDPNGLFDDGYQDGNGNYKWFDDHHESSFTENGTTWNRVTNNKNNWDEATTIRDAVIEGLVSLGYNKDEVKKDVSLYPETSNLFTKEAQLNNSEKYKNNWNKSFNSDTKKWDAFKSGKISNTSLHLKFYPTKGGEKNAIGIVKSGFSHLMEAGEELMEGFRCKRSGMDPKTDPYSDMHYDNAVLLLKSIQHRETPAPKGSSWVDAVYWRTGGMK